jgi:hypothetical protein
MQPIDRASQQGQVLALFSLALLAIVLGTAVIVDGGYAFSQRRVTQNAADFGAMAGTRIIGVANTGRPAGAGTGANVYGAIASVLAANDAQLVKAQYVDASGTALGPVVDSGSIPAGALGVVVDAKTDWRPFLLGAIGIFDWAASATATAMTDDGSAGDRVLPVGIWDDRWRQMKECPADGLTECVTNLTSGELNIPGGFGWLAFGTRNKNKCDWDSLGMDVGGCEVNQPFLDSQIGPPANSYGCCDPVTGTADDKVANLTGNEWGDLSYYIDNQIVMWVPIWDEAFGSGRNAYYHIVGFGAVLFTGTGTPHAKWLEGTRVIGTGVCLPGTEIPGKTYCSAPGIPFDIQATGRVRLVR